MENSRIMPDGRFFRRRKKGEADDRAAYWAAKTPAERLAAMAAICCTDAESNRPFEHVGRIYKKKPNASPE